MDIRDFIILRLEDMELMSFRMLQTASISTPEWEVGAQLQHTVDGLRDILDYHNNWVVALEGPIEIEPISADLKNLSHIDAIRFTASREIGFVTEQQYRVRFGKEPPTSPMIRAIARMWRDHPDYQEEWA